MQCPCCRTDMVREDIIFHYHKKVGTEDHVKFLPAASYYCPYCHGEWLWVLGRKLENLTPPEDPLYDFSYDDSVKFLEA